MTTKSKLILRSIDGTAIVRKEPDGKNFVEFYASVFNQQSKLIREWGEVFFEVIAPEAFTNVLADGGLNCLATVDHERSKILGRTKSGTLTLAPDAQGLKATVEMPDTTLGRDMLVLIERGDYFECSFIYTIADNGVSYDKSGDIPVRTITNIQNLYDVSIVLDGAFANTEIKRRAIEMEFEFKVTIDKKEDDEDPEATAAALVEVERALANEYDILEKELEILTLKK